jgi:hypothetical protein
MLIVRIWNDQEIPSKKYLKITAIIDSRFLIVINRKFKRLSGKRRKRLKTKHLVTRFRLEDDYREDVCLIKVAVCFGNLTILHKEIRRNFWFCNLVSNLLRLCKYFKVSSMREALLKMCSIFKEILRIGFLKIQVNRKANFLWKSP